MSTFSNNDKKKIQEALEGKVTQADMRKILTKIYRASEVYDHGDSPYTRPTFLKILLLIGLIISFLIWVVLPIYTLYNTGDQTKANIQKIVKERKIPLGESFAFHIQIEKKGEGKEVLQLYNFNGQKLLAQSDIINNKADVVSTELGHNMINYTNLSVLRTANSDLKEEIKDDILNILNKNISVNDTYLKFKSIDFGVDQIINKK